MNSKIAIPVIVIAIGIAALVGFALTPDDSDDIVDVAPAVVPVDGTDDIFESYESQVQRIVQDTVLLYMEDPENAFDIITAQSATLDGPIYPFVTADETFELVAHGANPDAVGLYSFDLITTIRSPEVIIDDLHTNDNTWIEYMFLNPSSGEDDLKRVWLTLYDGYIFGAGYYTHDEEIRQTIKEAILVYVDDKDNAFDTITSQAETLDSSLYPFILSDDGTFEILAHGANPDLIDVSAIDLINPNLSFDEILVKLNDDDDNDGYNSDGVWIEYVFENPETGTDQSKYAWWYLYDGYIFGSGYYDDGGDDYDSSVPFADYETQVKGIVDDVIDLYMEDKDNAFDIITAQSATRDGPLYPFVLSGDGAYTVIAHGANPAALGRDIPHVLAVTRTSDAILEDLHANGSTWVKYPYTNPASGVKETKSSWLVLHDGHIFGIGYYDSDRMTHKIVKDTILMYMDDKEDAFDTITAQAETLDSSFYPVVLSDDGTFEILAHGANPNLVGVSSLDILDPTPSFEQILVELNDDADNDGYNSQGALVEYVFENPETGLEHTKYGWFYLYDGYIFGSGYYSSDSDDDDSTMEKDSTKMSSVRHDGDRHDDIFESYASQAQRVVESVVSLYKTNSDDVFDMINAQSVTYDSSLYPVVLSGDTFEILAHGGNPDRVGSQASDSIVAGITSDEVLDDLNADGTAWLTYDFVSPATGIEKTKRVWLSVHDDYIFLVSYSVADDEIRQTVKDTILLYIDDKTNAFYSITSQASTLDGSLYPFVLSDDTGFEILAHGANPGLVGVLTADIVVPDHSFDQILAELHNDTDGNPADDGAWVEYAFENPETGTDQSKRAWWYFYDGYVFGSGHYSSDDDSTMEKDTTPKMSSMHDSGDGYGDRHDDIFESSKSQAQNIVEDAIQMYIDDKDNAFDIITSQAATLDSPLYPFVMSNDSTFVVHAHGADHDLVGVSVADIITTTSTADEILDNLNTDGATWIEYEFVNPVSGKNDTKHTWLFLHDGYIFSSGYYASDDMIRQTVKDAILLYIDDKENAFDTITAQSATLDSSVFPFVLSNDATFMILAHGAYPDLVGMSATERITPNFSFYQILTELHNDVTGNPTDDGVWAEYIYENPETGTYQFKQVWWYFYDGYVFGSGHYSPSTSLDS